MASRALTDMLTTAVSNWLTSASTKQGSIGQFSHDPDPGSGHGIEHIGKGVQAFVGVEHLRREGLATSKREQLAGELGRTIDRIGHCIHVALTAVVIEIGPSQEIDRRTNDRQKVVEVMGDAAGKLTDGLHLLALSQRFLGCRALADLPRDPLLRASR